MSKALYQRLNTMRNMIEYNVDKAKSSDLDEMVSSFQIDRESAEYEVYQNFMQSYKNYYEREGEVKQTPREPSTVRTMIGYSILGGIAGTPLDMPFLFAYFGLLLGCYKAIMNSRRQTVNCDPREIMIHAAFQNISSLERNK